jgi:hypothetical protein
MSAETNRPPAAGSLTFREMSSRYLEPASQWVMIAGIVFVCQPWVKFLHAYGITITLLGLIGFNVFSKIKPKTDG